MLLALAGPSRAQQTPSPQQSQLLQYAINLQSNVTELIRSSDDSLYTEIGNDGNYATLDTYGNTCLNKLETCSDGFTFIFDLRIVYSSSQGSVLLASTGGHSPYATSGIYLTQTSARGENYLEFGVCLNEILYKAQVNCSTKTHKISSFHNAAFIIFLSGKIYF